MTTKFETRCDSCGKQADPKKETPSGQPFGWATLTTNDHEASFDVCDDCWPSVVQQDQAAPAALSPEQIDYCRRQGVTDSRL